MYSETSLLQGMPPSADVAQRGRRRRSCSVIAEQQQRTPRPSGRRADARRQRESRCHRRRRSLARCTSLLGEELLQLRPVLRALLDDAGPARLVGLGAEGLASAPLNSITWMPAAFCLSMSASFSLADVGGLRLDPGRRVGDHLASAASLSLPQAFLLIRMLTSAL